MKKKKNNNILLVNNINFICVNVTRHDWHRQKTDTDNRPMCIDKNEKLCHNIIFFFEKMLDLILVCEALLI